MHFLLNPWCRFDLLYYLHIWHTWTNRVILRAVNLVKAILEVGGCIRVHAPRFVSINYNALNTSHLIKTNRLEGLLYVVPFQIARNPLYRFLFSWVRYAFKKKITYNETLSYLGGRGSKRIPIILHSINGTFIMGGRGSEFFVSCLILKILLRRGKWKGFKQHVQCGWDI